jgi:uncharacterized protein YkwD
MVALFILTGCSGEYGAEQQAFADVNLIRTTYGVPPLRPDNTLVDLARGHARDMADHHYFGHTPADGCNVVCQMERDGVPHGWAGENIEWNNWDWSETGHAAIRTWLYSPEHLKIMLGCHYTRAGVGVALSDDGRIYFSMVYEGDAPC